MGRVLLLDTDVPFRETLAGALERFAVDVSWQARILGLFDALTEADPIALVLSASLPGSDPLELIRAVRRSRWAELPILVVIDRPDRSFELRAYVDGADAVLVREGCVSELAAHILGHATRRRRQRRGAARDLADAALALRRPRPGAELEVPRSAHEEAVRDGEAPPASIPAPAPVRAPTFVGGAPTPVRTPTPAVFDAMAHEPAAAVTGDGRGSTEAGVIDRRPGLADAAVPDVILVDDDPSLLEMLRYAFTNRGYRTLSLSNGLDALRTLQELDTGDRRPVVLLDVDLPGLDGFRILHELGGCRPDDYQVILCTVHSSEATQVLGIQSGAIDYIVKPFRMPIVLAKVERLLGPAAVHTGA